MYVPRHFAPPSREAVVDLLEAAGACDLVTSSDGQLMSSMIPFLYERHGGGEGRLEGHLARANPQWRAVPDGEALVIVHGPDGYVSPSWYPSAREDGRVVPTWNYVVAHVYGRLVVHEDAGWTGSLVRRLSRQHEQHLAAPWSPDDAPAGFIESELRGIVGIEVAISRIEAKWKLSQNRSRADARGAAAGLEREGGQGGRPLAAAMRRELERGGV